MSELPSGTVTFLLTDVEGSTAAWQAPGSDMAGALDDLDAAVHAAVQRHEGTVVKARGEGDSHFAAFSRASSAVLAAVELQRARGASLGLAVRAALNVGEVEPHGGDYRAEVVNRTARLRSAAHGGQIVCTRPVGDLVAGLDHVSVRPLGLHRLRDHVEPVELYQVCAPGLAVDFPPLATLDMTATSVMTVVAVDHVGTQLRFGQNLDGLADWQRPLFRAFRDAANAYDGRYLKLVGDGCLAAFDAPHAALAFAQSLTDNGELGVRASVAAGVVEIVEGELTGAAVFHAYTGVKHVGVGCVWVAPVVESLVSGGK
jgi:class 3 adenylate cyclase